MGSKQSLQLELPGSSSLPLKTENPDSYYPMFSAMKAGIVYLAHRMTSSNQQTLRERLLPGQLVSWLVGLLVFSKAGGMAQLGKCPLCKHEALSLDSQHTYKSQAKVARACNLGAREVKTGRSLELTSQPS